MKNNNQAGKGDRYRPVDKKRYDLNFDSINWGDRTKSLDKNISCTKECKKNIKKTLI
jgi:hypothetical protein